MSFRYNGRGVREISFESLARPLMALQDKQEKYEDSISLLNSEAAKYEAIANSEPNSEAAALYKGMTEQAKAVADELATKGVLDTSIRSKVMGLNTTFNKNILPIGQAYENKMKELSAQTAALRQNPNLRVNRKVSDISIDDYMNGKIGEYKMLDLNTAKQSGALTGAVLNSINRGDKLDPAFKNQLIQINQTLGYSPIEVNSALSKLEKGEELSTSEQSTLMRLIGDNKQRFESTLDPEMAKLYGKEISSAWNEGLTLTAKQDIKTNYMGNKKWEIDAETAAANSRAWYAQSLNTPPPPDPDDLGPGIMATNGKISQGTEVEVKSRINEANNFKLFSTQPNTKFSVTNPGYKKFFKDKIKPKADQLENELNKMSRTNINAPKTPEYQAKQAKYQEYYKQIKDLEKGTFTATGKELADFYQQTYKAKNYQQVQNILNKKAFLGTHTNMAGYELTSEFAKAVVPELVRKSEGELKVIKLNKEGQKDGTAVIKDADLKDSSGKLLSLNIKTDGITGKVYLIIGSTKYILDSSVIPDRYDQKNNKINLIQGLENSNDKLFNTPDLYINPENDVNIAAYDKHMRVIMKYFTALAAQSTQNPSAIK